MKNKIIYLWAFCLCVAFVSCGEEEDEEPTPQPTAQQPIFNQPLDGAAAVKDSSGNTATPSVFTGFQMGDIIFQTTTGKFMLPIQQATGNNFTHCGLVAVGKNGNVFVVEAFDSVMRTPVDKWINRGAGGKYAVLRLKQSGTQMNESAQVKLRHAAKTYLGLPYDSFYGWADDKMYCSELVYKLMWASGVNLCKQRALKEYDLSSAAVKAALKQVYGGNIPYNELMVSPADIFTSPELEIVYQN